MFYEVQIVSGSVFIADLPAFLQSLNSFSEKNNIKIQGFDARKIIDQDHLFFSIHRARQAFESGTNEAKDIGLEVMRFSSGQKQIGKSFSMGLIQGENRSYFILFGESSTDLDSIKNAFTAEFCLSECSELTADEKRPFLMNQFGIADAELKAAGEHKFKDLILERIALVDLTR